MKLSFRGLGALKGRIKESIGARKLRRWLGFEDTWYETKKELVLKDRIDALVTCAMVETGLESDTGVKEE